MSSKIHHYRKLTMSAFISSHDDDDIIITFLLLPVCDIEIANQDAIVE
jgi:hypothetical protein